MKTLDKILLILGVFLGLFIIAMIVLFIFFQSVPDSLIYAVLGSGSSELILSCVIKCTKLKAGIKEDENDS